MQGSKSLKIMGILGIIFGALTILLNVKSFIDVAPYLGYATLLGINSGLFIIAAILSILAGVALLISGIMGIVNWNKPEKVSICVVLGIVTIVITVLANVLAFLSYPSGVNVVTIFSGLLVPITYVAVAYQYKKSFSQINQINGQFNNPINGQFNGQFNDQFNNQFNNSYNNQSNDQFNNPFNNQ